MFLTISDNIPSGFSQSGYICLSHYTLMAKWWCRKVQWINIIRFMMYGEKGMEYEELRSIAHNKGYNDRLDKDIGCTKYTEYMALKFTMECNHFITISVSLLHIEVSKCCSQFLSVNATTRATAMTNCYMLYLTIVLYSFSASIFSQFLFIKCPSADT